MERVTHESGAGRRAGFTLVETVIASSLGVLATAAVTTLFVWCAAQSSVCTKTAWSQNQAERSARLLTDYIRNASVATNMDFSQGRWIELRFPDRSWSRLVYSNSQAQIRDGRLYLVRSNGTSVVVARGMTEIMDSQGFTTPVFSKPRDNCVRLSYRVSEPVSSGWRSADDADYAACVQLSVSLRNAAY